MRKKKPTKISTLRERIQTTEQEEQKKRKKKVGKTPGETLLWFWHMGINGKKKYSANPSFNQNIFHLVCKFQQLRKHPTQSPQSGVSMFYVNTA